MNKNTYRIRNHILNQWWEGNAESAYETLILSGWESQQCEIKVHSDKGCGGWCKCKEVIPATAA